VGLAADDRAEKTDAARAMLICQMQNFFRRSRTSARMEVVSAILRIEDSCQRHRFYRGSSPMLLNSERSIHAVDMA
jgi:hypothetical protein